MIPVISKMQTDMYPDNRIITSLKLDTATANTRTERIRGMSHPKLGLMYTFLRQIGQYLWPSMMIGIGVSYKDVITKP